MAETEELYIPIYLLVFFLIGLVSFEDFFIGRYLIKKIIRVVELRDTFGTRESKI